MRSIGSLNLLQEKRGRTGKNLIKDGGRTDSLGGRDEVLLFISSAFLSCDF